jgi:uncharacterized repeat protein (TIGR01451 family)
MRLPDRVHRDRFQCGILLTGFSLLIWAFCTNPQANITRHDLDSSGLSGRTGLQASTHPSVPLSSFHQSGIASAITASNEQKAQALQALQRMPLLFEANEGQTDARVKFIARGKSYRLALTAHGATVDFARPVAQRAENPQSRPQPSQNSRIRMNLEGANPEPKITGIEPLEAKTNYYLGNVPKAWHTDVATFGKVRYEKIYPGIDMVFYGNQGQLEYDLIVAPRAESKAIRLSFEGAHQLAINAAGDLEVKLDAGELLLKKPRAYQESAGEKQEVAARYLIEGSEVATFQVDAYDPGRPLVIDPVLNYSTYLGGTAAESARAIAVDANGNVYITGWVYGDTSDFPVTPNAYQILCGQDPSGKCDYNNGAVYDAFVAKLNPSQSGGMSLEYASYLGGSGSDAGSAVAVDSLGHMFVIGSTSSTDFPIAGAAFQSSFRANFLAEFDTIGGGLVYSTFFGGTGNCGCSFDAGAGAIALDVQQNIYIAGSTNSSDFPVTPGAFQTSIVNGHSSVFLLIFANSGGSVGNLTYGTFLSGGNGSESGSGVAVDANGVYITGSTSSSDFPVTASAFQSSLGGNYDAFVARLVPAGNGASDLAYSTFLGGSGVDIPYGLAAYNGGAYITGKTLSNDIPSTPSAFQPSCASCNASPDAFIARIDTLASGSVSLGYASLLGGSMGDVGTGIAVDSNGAAYISGITLSTDFRTTKDAFRTTCLCGNGTSDAFAAKIDTNALYADSLVYSTFLGGSSQDEAWGVGIDSAGDIYLTGDTVSADFPTTANAFDTTVSGQDVFLAVIPSPPAIPHTDLSVTMSATPNPVSVGDNVTYTIVATNNGPSPATGVLLTDTIPSNPPIVSIATTAGTCVQATLNCMIGSLASGASATVTVVVQASATGTLTSGAEVTGNEEDPNFNNNSATSNVSVVPVSSDISVTNTAPAHADTSSQIIYSINVTNNGPSPANSIHVSDTLPTGTAFVSAAIAGGSCTSSTTKGKTPITTVSCTLGALNASSSATATITVQAPSKAATISDTASASASQPDPNAANNSSTAITIVAVPSADLSVVNVAPASIAPGAAINYSITVYNSGPDSATGVTMTAILPKGTIFVSASPNPGGTCGETVTTKSTTVKCSAGTLTVGTSAIIGITAQAPAKAATVSATATVTATQSDPNTANNSAIATTTVP